MSSRKNVLTKVFATSALISLILLGSFTSSGLAKQETASTDATPEAALPVIPSELTDYAADWPTAQGNLQATRQATTTIDSSNVDQLQVAWRLPVDKPGLAGSLTSNPVIVGNVVYIQDMQSNIYALDRLTGSEIWRKDYNAPANGPNGVGLGYGLVFATVGADSTVVALKAETGEEVWNHRLAQSPGTGAQMAPIVYNGQVFVSTTPNGPTEYYQAGNRGVLYALDPLTGNELWWFDTTDDNAWNAPREAGGGGLWYPPSFDADGNLYFGTGNPGPITLTGGAEHCINANCRPGNNDYSNSMVSLDATTGGLRWNVNAKPHDQFDLDFQDTPVIATVDNNGNQQTLAIGSGKTGTVIAVDAVSGQVAWWTPIGRHQNDLVDQIPDGESILVYPGPSGGVQGPLAYADNTIFANYFDQGLYFTSQGIDMEKGGDTYGAATGGFVAIDAVTGQIKWETKVNTVPVSGLVVANDLVFGAGIDGLVRAFNIETGEQVYQFQANAGINAPLAIAGDTLIIEAGTFYQAHDGDTPVISEPVTEVIALRLPDGTAPATSTEAPATAATSEPTAAPVDESTPAATTSSTEVAITLNDVFFDPKDLTIPANTDVTVTVTNNGVAQHDLTIDDLGLKTPLVAPGETVTLTINAAPGTYQFFCSVPGHREAGMAGTLTVQ